MKWSILNQFHTSPFLEKSSMEKKERKKERKKECFTPYILIKKFKKFFCFPTAYLYYNQLGPGHRARAQAMKRVPGSEFLGKRAPGSEFLGKRAPGSEFLGKRSISYDQVSVS